MASRLVKAETLASPDLVSSSDEEYESPELLSVANDEQDTLPLLGYDKEDPSGLYASAMDEISFQIGNVEISDKDNSSGGEKENVPTIDISSSGSDLIDISEEPRRIEPPRPGPLKTKFLELEELPSLPQSQVPVTNAASQALGLNIPKSTHNQVDRALSHLAETIALVPKPEEFESSPNGLLATLYPHQGYGLRWLWWREHHVPGGGILADEMGLGKTVMILALVLKSLNEGSPTYEEKKDHQWLSNEKKLIPSKCTLVVAPAGMIGQWENEIRSKTRNVKLLLFHGPRRTTSAAELSRYHVVLTTYHTVNSEIPKGLQSGSILLKVNFERIVLDEGHNIRNEKTNAAYGCCRLYSRHRWIVTGTPVHNKPADMHSLVKFLRLEPFDDNKLWDYWIGLKKLSTTANSATRLSIIAKALVLRRTKEEVKDCGGPSIPPKTVCDVELELSKEEREVYQHLEEFAKNQFNLFLKNQEDQMKEKQSAADAYTAAPHRRKKTSEEGEANFASVLTLILRLRQCCCLPYLISSMIDEEDVDKDLNPDASDTEHIISLSNPVFGENYLSSKIKRLIVDIDGIREKCRGEQKQMDKVVIVSQWTSFLNIIKSHLHSNGYRTCEINGKVKISERAEITLRFNRKEKRPEILLLSLAAGGVGLNLIGANHLFLMDLHWNPQMELQAQDRIHRFGQTKDVTIYRYKTKDTIEERVLELQSVKLALASDMLQKKINVGSGLNINEVRKLFQM